MPGINRQPRGLLDFLQVQAGGNNPDQLSETVRPVVDIEPFYSLDRIFAAEEAISMTGGQLEFIEIPEGEVWKVLTMGFSVALDATAAMRASFMIERIEPLGLNGIIVGNALAINDSSGSAQTCGAAIQFPVPLMVRSGQDWSSDVTVKPNQARLSARSSASS